MTEITTTAKLPTRMSLVPRHGARRLRQLAYLFASMTVAAIVAEGAIRLALDNAFMSAPVFQATTGTVSYALLPSVSVLVRQFGRTLSVSTDPSGHRFTPGASSTAPVNLHLIGDSQVFGWGLSDNETLSAQLQRRVGQSVRVVNHGVPGYGPEEYLAVLKSIPTYEPVVVVFTEENDGGDAYKLAKQANVACGFISSFEREGAIQCALMRSRSVQSLFVSLNQMNHHYHMTPLGFSDHSRVAARVIQARIAQQLSKQTAQRTGHTLYTVVPWKGRFSPQWRTLYAPPPVAGPRTLPTPFPESLDTVRQFAAHTDAESLYLVGDTHLSPAGASLLADLVATGVQSLMGTSLLQEQK